jgi:hypothetical protein
MGNAMSIYNHCPKCGKVSPIIGEAPVNLAYSATQIQCDHCGYVEQIHRIFPNIEPPKEERDEWTPEWLRQYTSGYSSFDLALKGIADAHEAALKVERDARVSEVELQEREIRQIREQLKAEREKRERSDKFRERLRAKYRTLEEQLVAAQAALASVKE